MIFTNEQLASIKKVNTITNNLFGEHYNEFMFHATMEEQEKVMEQLEEGEWNLMLEVYGF